MVLGGLVLRSLIVYLKGMRIMMFQLSGYYYSNYLDPKEPAFLVFLNTAHGQNPALPRIRNMP